MANKKDIKERLAKRFNKINTDNETLLRDMNKLLTPIYFRDLNRDMMASVIEQLVKIGRKDILKEITKQENDIIVGYYIKEKDIKIVR